MATAKKLASGSWRCQVYSHTEEIIQPDGTVKRNVSTNPLPTIYRVRKENVLVKNKLLIGLLKRKVTFLIMKL